jgi:hypothetical protein
VKVSQVEIDWPAIPWREPIRVTRTDGVSRWACRICIAAYGLRGADVGRLFESPELVLEHLEQFH